DLAFKPRHALDLLAHHATELVAPRREVRERARDLGKGLLARKQRHFRRADALGDRALPRCGAVRLLHQAVFLLVEPAERRLRVGGEALFARLILAELDEPP